MSSSISSATSQQQFFQAQQTTPKQDAQAKTGNADTNAIVAQQAVKSASVNSLPEPASRRNNDGTYGPKHTATPPYNPLKAAPKEEGEVGVNVQI